MIAIEDVALLLTCPRCAAEPGYWCVTVRGRYPGRLTPRLHAGREAPILQVWQESWADGNAAGYRHALYVAARSLRGARERDGVNRSYTSTAVEDWLHALAEKGPR